MKTIKRIYDFCLKCLLTPPFKWIYQTLSHGAFHIALFLIVGWLAWQFYNNNQAKLKDTVTHTIWVKAEALSSDADQWGYRRNLYMKNFLLELILNSDSIDKRTDGKYRDALKIQIMPPINNKDDQIIAACSDTITVSVLRQPCNSNVIVEDYANDTLPGNKNLPKAEVIKDSAGVCKINTVLANWAKAPCSSNWIKRKDLTIYSNDFGIGESPYYYYNIKFEIPNREYLDTLQYPNVQYQFGINLDDSWTYNDDFGRYSTKQIVIHEITPKPDYIKGNYIGYFSKESIASIIKNGGVKLYAEDLSVSNKNKQEEFLNSVLVGTCLAFMLDIIIQLVLKLRRLHQSRRNDKKTS